MINTVQGSYVAIDASVLGGKPHVSGTRIRVHDLYRMQALEGAGIDEIIEAYPTLTPAQIHGALTYAWEHLTEIQGHIDRDWQFAQELRSAGPSLTEKIRAEIHGATP